MKLTEAEAWRTIGEAFEARAAHPELAMYDWETDLAYAGLCRSNTVLFEQDKIGPAVSALMYTKIQNEVQDPRHYNGAFLGPRPTEPGGAELRATLAYLFAEEAAA